MGLRQSVDGDLSRIMAAWGVDVILTGPDGTVYDSVKGQPFSQVIRIDPDTGQEIVAEYPHVTLQISSLEVVPVAGETWFVRLPLQDGGDIHNFIIDATRPPEPSKTLGWIKLYLQKVRQS